MILYVNEEKVLQQKPQESNYKGKKFITLVVNENIVLKSRDLITYSCDRCNNIFKEKFSYNKKFFSKSYWPECKKIETSLNKYGTDHIFQSQDVKEKIKQTKEKLYGDKDYSNRKKAEKTNLKKYGVKYSWQAQEVKEKIKQTNLNKYGKTNPMLNESVKTRMKKTTTKRYDGVGFKSEKIKEKIKQTNLNKYGVTQPQSLEQVKNKIKKTNLERYGVSCSWRAQEVKEKIKQTNSNKYFQNLLLSRRLNNVKPLFDKNSYNGTFENYEWECIICGNIFSDNLSHGHIPRCKKCFPRTASISEKEIVKYIQSLGINNIVENSKKIIPPYELDIYLPDYNLAIEFDGLYWHSELQGKNKQYHLDKTIECEKQGIRLIHIFEDEWLNKKEIIKYILSSKLGFNKKLYARKCDIKEVDNQKKFLEANHLQGYIPAKINIGLYYNNKLVSLLTFSKPRFNKKYDWEILRYASDENISVIGGFAKMLKYFKNNYKGSIITYSDRRWFDGVIYELNGFKKLNVSKPSYYYTDYKDKYNRQKFQKHKLKYMLETFDPNLTEWQNMQINGWDRIWDCGNNCFEVK